MLLSIISIPFKLLMNILTIINSLIFLSIFLAIYYLYINREYFTDYIKNKILDLIKDTNFNKLSRNFNKLTTNFNKDEDTKSFNKLSRNFNKLTTNFNKDEDTKSFNKLSRNFNKD